MTLYGITTCGSVKKARKYLDERGVAYAFVDLKKTPVGEGTIRKWLTETDLKTLLNTRGTKYRTLGLSGMDLDDEGKILWMAKENLLIKRPVIEHDGGLIVGFDETLYDRTF